MEDTGIDLFSTAYRQSSRDEDKGKTFSHGEEGTQPIENESP
uniref:Bravo_FIGEY domain-containing protein n=1 Tax=Strongyloides papillosus TaxID=174720 RepID=A0A0N5BZS3_STREA